MTKLWIGVITFLVGNAAGVAGWLAIVQPFFERKVNLRIMVCTNPKCQEYVNDPSYEVVNLTGGLSSEVVIPGLTEGDKLLDYDCRVLDNKEFLQGYGKLSIVGSEPSGVILSSSSRGSGHIPVQVTAVYTSSRLMSNNIKGAVECSVP